MTDIFVVNPEMHRHQGLQAQNNPAVLSSLRSLQRARYSRRNPSSIIVQVKVPGVPPGPLIKNPRECMNKGPGTRNAN